MLVRFAYIGATSTPGVRSGAQQRLQRAVETGADDRRARADPAAVHRRRSCGVIDKHPADRRQRPHGRPDLGARSSTRRSRTGPTVAKQVTEKTEVGDGTMTVTMADEGRQDVPVGGELLLADRSSGRSRTRWRSGSTSPPRTTPRRPTPTSALLLAAADTTPTTGVADDLDGWTAAIAAAAGQIYARHRPLPGHDLRRHRLRLQAARASVSAVAPVFLATGGANLANGDVPDDRRAAAGRSRPGLPAEHGRRRRLATRCCAPRPPAPRSSCGRSSRRSAGIEVGIIGAFLSRGRSTRPRSQELTPA